MRDSYIKQLQQMHTELIRMGAYCEESINCAVKGLLYDDAGLRERAFYLEDTINLKQREIEGFCVKLLLREQPVASDLRQITTAQKMIIDMERIGDQARDIAEISTFTAASSVKSDIHIADMASSAIKMLTDSVDSFVRADLDKARQVVDYDDIVDELFDKIKSELIDIIMADPGKGGDCLDLLMIAKYLERIGDHAENIAESVVYWISGQ
ncbi:MAG: phosphate signaling complex protein PhoU [Clostridiales Family XIII bacterium]|jgi:phosphate transport system protein|nr:phosphate signaling complex protein PhoU [Clostridiales Family XIII bacterium]